MMPVKGFNIYLRVCDLGFNIKEKPQVKNVKVY